MEGEEHLGFPGGAIVAPSHASFFDPPLVACSTKTTLHFLARESLFKTPIMGWLIRHLNTHPVKGNSSLKSIRKVVGLIKEGDKVVIFPEGHRSPDGTLQTLEPGITLIASRAECPIVPVLIEGAYEAWGRHRRFPRPWGKIRIIFGKPIPWSRFAHLGRKDRSAAILKETREAILALRDSAQQD